MATTGRSRVRAGLQLWGAKRFSGSLLWWAAALAALTLITRIPLRSTQLFAWDSANFALALQHYNVAWHQPQPPGYILYVAAARLIHVVVADANAAYVWLSVLASVGAVWCTVLVGGRLFGTATGVLGGLVLAVVIAQSTDFGASIAEESEKAGFGSGTSADYQDMFGD